LIGRPAFGDSRRASLFPAGQIRRPEAKANTTHRRMNLAIYPTQTNTPADALLTKLAGEDLTGM
jgi:hypothetical protein